MTKPSDRAICDDCGEYLDQCTCGPLRDRIAELEAALAASQARVEILEKEMELLRLVAAEPHYTSKVKDVMGPLSLWTKEGLDAEIYKRVNAALSESAQVGERHD